jgi:hypothetical protein
MKKLFNTTTVNKFLKEMTERGGKPPNKARFPVDYGHYDKNRNYRLDKEKIPEYAMKDMTGFDVILFL